MTDTQTQPPAAPKKKRHIPSWLLLLALIGAVVYAFLATFNVAPTKNDVFGPKPGAPVTTTVTAPAPPAATEAASAPVTVTATPSAPAGPTVDTKMASPIVDAGPGFTRSATNPCADPKSNLGVAIHFTRSGSIVGGSSTTWQTHEDIARVVSTADMKKDDHGLSLVWSLGDPANKFVGLVVITPAGDTVYYSAAPQVLVLAQPNQGPDTVLVCGRNDRLG
jgi:hypothetical protein